MSHASLQRPVWSMLNGPQSHLAQATGSAVRIDPRYGPFAAAQDQSETAQSDLARIVRQADAIWLVEPGEWPAPSGTKIARTARLVQMVAAGDGLEKRADETIVPLSDEDVPEMTELALATKPGPWAERTHRYGQFFGIRDCESLAAMAGERMRPADGFAEVSGVCTWPEYRGRGMARRLIAHVMAAQRARGDTPFLHSYADNGAAIGLYESLGFAVSRNLVVTVLTAA